MGNAIILGTAAIVPDGFLAIGVPRLKDEGGRLSYVLWQEQVKPIMFLEVVSKEYNGEYEQKLSQYQELGILYYVIYNSLIGRRGRYKKHESLEVYKLTDGKYELLPSVTLLSESGKVVWMPEIGLGIGCERRTFGNWERDWLYWYDRDCVRYPTADERAQQAEVARQQSEGARQQAEAIAMYERQEKEKLVNLLRSMGIDPDAI